MPKYPRLQSLKEINSVMTRYYVQRKAMARVKPLAYVTSGAPVELMEAMGILTLYPENYGALCGARKVAVDLCQVAEATGYPADLCSYARSHIGAVLQPRDAPLNGLPRPDLLVCCSNICGTVLKWYQALAALYNVPLFVLDVPFQRITPAEPHIVAYVTDQLREFVTWLEAHTGRRLEPDRFHAVLTLSQQAVALWQEILEFGQHRPSPINAPDLFIAMAPIVALRGTRRAVDGRSVFAHRYSTLSAHHLVLRGDDPAPDMVGSLPRTLLPRTCAPQSPETSPRHSSSVPRARHRNGWRDDKGGPVS